MLIVDVNLDGKPDIYVANDTTERLLYINRSRPGKILFEEMGVEAGVARDDHGASNGSMGLAAGDPLGTGRPALLVANYEAEMQGLYINECQGERISFRFGSQVMGLSAIKQVYVELGNAIRGLRPGRLGRRVHLQRPCHSLPGWLDSWSPGRHVAPKE